ncbi:MAG: hypothetical protein KatS3mg059_0283 [Thermomicrobiales bacterium]|nr:MAG: hypothetical protein KatS3mg059_0283 [Thermomicrobiales bacterium]
MVAWTADDGTDFAVGWPQWERYDEFWANVVRWALPDPENRPLQVGAERQGTEVAVTVTAIGDRSRLCQSRADVGDRHVSLRERVSADIPLYQSGPGEYQFRVNAPESGAYAIQLRQARAGGTIEELAGFSVPPSPELQPAPDGRAFMEAIAQRTGGRILSLDEPGAVFAAGTVHGPGTPLRDYQPVWFVPLEPCTGVVLLWPSSRCGMEFLPRLRGLWLGAR